MSSSGKSKKNKKMTWVSAGDIAKEVGYTSDYITRLAREKKIKGKKIGKRWMVNPISVASFIEKKNKEKVARSKALRKERKEEHTTPQIETTPQTTLRRLFDEHVVPVVKKQKPTLYAKKPKYFDVGLVARVHALIATSGIMLAGVLLGVVGYAVPTETDQMFSRVRATDTVVFVSQIGGEFFDSTSQVAGTFSALVGDNLKQFISESPKQYAANVFWSDVWCGFKSLIGRECLFDTGTRLAEEDIPEVVVIEDKEPVAKDRVIVETPVIAQNTTASYVNPVTVVTQDLPDIFPAKWLDQITSRKVHVIQTNGNMRSIEDLGAGIFDRFRESITTGTLVVDGNATIEGALSVNDFLATSTITTYASIVSPYITATSTTATSTFAGGLAVETNGFVYDYATNKVGIGTAAPETRLTLQQEFDNFGGGFRVNQLTDSDYFEFIGIADRVALGLNGTETFSFLENGSLGIGTSSPTYNLEVLGDARFTASVDATYFTATSTTATTTLAGGLAIETTGFVYDYATNKVGIGTASPTFRFDVVGDGRFTGLVDASHFVATSTTATSTFAGGLTVDSFDFVVDPDSNRVGIGTTNLTSLLTLGYTTSIISTDSSDGGDSKRIQIAGGGTAGTERGASIEVMGNEYTGEAGDLSLYAGNSAVLGQGALRFFTGNVLERMTIDANGNVGIGTTSPAQLLSVAGNGYLTGGLGIGVATTTPGTLQTSGNGWIGGDLVVVGNSTVFGDSATLGESSADTLVVNSSIGSDLIPTINATYDIGNPSFFWDNGYFDTITANNISAASSSISGTQSETFTINSNNATADTEDMDLIFFRGNVVPNALISWNSSFDLFDINQPLFIQNDSSTTTVRTLDVLGTAGQTADLFRVASSSGMAFFNVLANGNVGIGTTTPAAEFAVAGDIYIDGTLTASTLVATSSISVPAFTATNATSTTFAVTSLTQGRVPYIGVGGLLLDTADFTFDGTSLTSPVLVASNATATSTFAGGIAVETNGFVYDYSTNKVGIGTDSPEAWLSVEAASGELLRLTRTGVATLSAYATSGDGDSFAYLTGDAGASQLQFRDDSTLTYTGGSIGIGTTSAQRILHISGTTPIIRLQDSDYDEGFGEISANGGTLSLRADENSDVISSYIDFRVDGSEKVRIDSSGNVGIASTSPAGKFVVHSSNSRYLNYLPLAGLADFELVSNNNSQPVFAVRGTGTADLVNIFDDETEVFTVRDGGNVGIGVTDPAETLEVKSLNPMLRLTTTSATGIAGINFEDSTGTVEWALGFRGVDEKFYIGNDDQYPIANARLVIDSSGNIGIGTSTPLAKLSVSTGTSGAGASSVADELIVEGAGNTGITIASPDASVSTLAFTTPSASVNQGALVRWDYTNDSFELGSNKSGASLNFKTGSFSQAMTIDSSGNVGIGTTDPENTLEVESSGEGTLAIGTSANLAAGETSGVLKFYSRGFGTDDTLSAQIKALLAADDSDDSHTNLAFYTSNGGLNEQMRITNTGNVGIGTTTPDNILTIARDSSTSANAPFLEINNPHASVDQGNTLGGITWTGADISTGGTGEMARINIVAENSGTQYSMRFGTRDGTNGIEDRVVIDNDGNLGVGTTSPASRLHVEGTSTFYGVGSAVLDWGNTSSLGRLTYSGSSPVVTALSGDLIIARTSGLTETARFTSAGRLGLGITNPDGKLHVHTASAGSASPDGAIDDLIVENETAGGITILTPDASTSSFAFGSPSDSNGANIQWNYNANLMTIGTRDVGASLRFDTANGAEAMRIDSSGNVGVGITNPQDKLHVAGNILLSAGAYGLESYIGATAYTLIERDTSDNGINIGFNTASQGAIDIVTDNGITTFAASGNVGIGTTTPDSLLNVVGADPITLIKDTETSTANANSIIRLAESTTGGVTDNYWDITAGGSVDGDFGFSIGSDDTPDALVIDRLTGNVGVGSFAASPAELLEVRKDNDGSDTSLLIVNSASTGSTDETAEIKFALANNLDRIAKIAVAREGTFSSAGTADTSMRFFNSLNGTPTEQLTILSDGSVGIGTTTPTSKLHVFSSVATNLTMERDATNQWAFLLSSGSFQIQDKVTTGIRLAIDSSGDTTLAGALAINGVSGLASANYDDLVLGNVSSGSHGLTIQSNLAGASGIAFGDGVTASTASRTGRLDFDHADNTFKQYVNDSLIYSLDATQAYFPALVGIGTTTPSQRLHIYRSTNSSVGVRVDNPSSGSAATAVYQAYNDTTTGYGWFGVGGTGYSILSGLQDRAFVLAGPNTAGINIYNEGVNPTIFTTNDVESMRIDSSGRLLVGHSSSVGAALGLQGGVQVSGTTGSDAAMTVNRFSDDAFGAYIALTKSRGSLGGSTIVQDDDVTGYLTFGAGDGTDLNSEVAAIRAEIDGTPGSNDVPGRLTFSTTADGSASATERMRIDSAGNVSIGGTGGAGRLDVRTNDADDEVLLVLQEDAGADPGPFYFELSDTDIPGLASKNMVIRGSSSVSDLAFSPSSDTPAALVVKDGGNIGINTTQPQGHLDINNENANATNVWINGEANQEKILHLRHWSNSEGAGAAGYNAFVGSIVDNYGTLGHFNPSGTQIDVLSWGENGRVGIGTTSPLQKLDVDDDSNGYIASFSNENAVGYGLQVTTSDTSNDRRALSVQTGGGNVIVTNAGNLGLGTASPETKFDVNGISTFRDLAYFGTSASRQGYVTWGGGVSNTMNVSGATGKALSLGSNGVYDRLFLDTAGNVGIGTTTPASKLHVSGGAITLDNNQNIQWLDAGGTTRTLIDFDSNENLRIGRSGAMDEFQVFTGGDTSTQRLTIDSSGNVGIGTTTPNYALTIQDNAFYIGQWQGNASTFPGYLYSDSGGAGLTFGSEGFSGSAKGAIYAGSNFNFYLGASGDYNFRDNSNNEIFTIESGGNVGIGATSDLTILTAVGSSSDTTPISSNQPDTAGGVWAQIGNSDDTTNNTQGLAFVGTGSSATTLTQTASIYAINTGRGGSYSYGDLAFTTTSGAGTPTEHLRITSSGNVGIGTTSPYAKLAITNANSYVALGDIQNRFVSTGTSALADFLIVDRDNSNTRAALQVQGNNGATEVLFASSGGRVGIGETDPQATLHISSNSSYPTLRLEDTGGSQYAEIFTNNDELYIGADEGNVGSQSKMYLRVDASEVMTLDSSGNVGIGTTSPLGTLNVYSGASGVGTASTLADELVVEGLGNSGISILGSATSYAGVYFGNSSNNDAGSVRYEGNVDKLSLWTADTQAVTIDSSGNVGIGTTDPDSKLHIEGTNTTLPTTGVYQQLEVAQGSNRLSLGVLSSAVGSAGAGTGIIQPLINGSQFTNLSLNPNGGNVGIGTATPDAKLEISDVVNDNLRIGTRGGNMNLFSVTDAGARAPLAFEGSEFHFIEGNVGIGTTTPVSTLSVQGSLCVRSTGSCGTTAGTIYATTGSISNIDVAENYPTIDATIAAGEIVTLDAYNNEYIKRASYGDAPFGIISTAPGITLGGEDTDGKPVALAGRVPVKVNGEGGAIAVGDRITLSLTEPGVGMRATESVRTIGIALEPYTATTTTASIMVAVENEYTFAPAEFALKSANTGFGTSSPYAKLAVVNETSGPSFIVEDSAGGDGTPFIVDTDGKVGIGTSTPTAQLHTTGSVRFENFGAGALQTDANGNLTVSSDERLKDISGSFDRGLEDIRDLEPILYSWNEFSGFETQTVYAGFSAQNVQASIPEAVGQDKYGFLTLADRPILAAAINAIKELDLDLQSLADEETLFSEVEVDSFTARFLSNLVAWFADTANGIGSMIAGTFQATEQLCINDTCVSESQLQQLLSGEGVDAPVEPEEDDTEDNNTPGGGGGSNDNNATTTDDGGDVATSTDDGTDDIATSTDDGTDEEDIATSTDDGTEDEEIIEDEESTEEIEEEEVVEDEEPEVEEDPAPEPEPEPTEEEGV